jgi:hypothetical protein
MIARVIFAIALTAILAAAAGPRQPIAYSHQKHLAMADIGPAATLPSIAKCMLCHNMAATDNPEVKKMAAYAAKGEEIPWVRVYGFAPHAFVRFNHAAHIHAKVDCATCHGDMTKVDTAQKLVNHNMGTCLSCHRQKGAPQDCATCHY